MKLLLSDKENPYIDKPSRGSYERQVFFRGAGIQLDHIFNLDMKTTSELIVKLEARLDELYQKEVAK